jgi:hypothetical protein
VLDGIPTFLHEQSTLASSTRAVNVRSDELRASSSNVAGGPQGVLSTLAAGGSVSGPWNSRGSSWFRGGVRGATLEDKPPGVLIEHVFHRVLGPPATRCRNQGRGERRPDLYALLGNQSSLSTFDLGPEVIEQLADQPCE